MFSLESLFGEEATILRERDFRVLLLAALIPVLGPTLVSPVLDSLIEPYGVTAANISLMVSVFNAPAIATIALTGVIADRVGRKPVLVGALLLFGLGGTALAFTTDYRVALALRFLQGAGFGGITPMIITSVGDLYSGGREATGQGLRFMMTGFSGAVFPIIASLLVVVAWHYPFYLYAIAFPVALVVWLLFEEPATSGLATASDGGTEASYSRALFGLLRRRRVAAFVVARALINGVWAGFLTYNSLMVVHLMGGNAPQAGLLAAVGFVVFAIAASQAGRIAEYLEGRIAVLVGANVVYGGGFLALLFAPSVWVATIGIAVSGVGFGVMGALYRSVITDLAPDDLRASLVSVSEMGGRVTSTLAPVAMGSVIAFATPVFGFDPAIRLAGIAVAVVCAGGGIVCLLVASVSVPVPRRNY